MIHEPTVFTSSQRNNGASIPGGFRKIGRADEIFQQMRQKPISLILKFQFKDISLSSLRDICIGRNKYLYQSQKQMMAVVIDSTLPGTHKNEKSVEGF